MGLFSFVTCLRVAKTALRLFSEEVISYVAVVLVCSWREVTSGYSYVAILKQNLSFILRDKFFKNDIAERGFIFLTFVISNYMDIFYVMVPIPLKSQK